jgi:glycerol-3-phosphate acyltransferase PlsY
MTGFFLIILSYFIGSFSIGYHLVRWKKNKDIRDCGSGGTGATNVGRLLGASGFFITLLGDGIKAVLVLFLGQTLQQPPIVIALLVVAVIAGHLWPFYLNFKGGKGIATLLGAFLMVDITIVIFIATITLLIFAVTRQFTLSWVLAIFVLFLFIGIVGYEPTSIAWSLVVSSLMILYAHRNNIKQKIFGIDLNQEEK